MRPDIFKVQDEGLPIEEIVKAADAVRSTASPEQLEALEYHIDSPEWRSWSNPEFLLSHKGLRLDEVAAPMRDAILSVLEATLSPEGYSKARSAMRINGFLGDLVESPRVMNEFSYNFALFGTPSTTKPWGFSFYGHHLCLNVFLYRRQIVASPWFTGAEPNEIDTGQYNGTRILHVEEQLGLKLMQSLSSREQSEARVYEKMHDERMPANRWNRDDQRHLCGAYRDNRIIPYEGIIVSNMRKEQQDLVIAIFEQYLLYLPERSRKMKIDHILSFASETYFSWIGGFAADDPFYYRIQSPVIIAEFDHHSGVFLTNGEPAKFHVHTILRTPNAGDYGYALRGLCVEDSRTARL